MFIPRTRNIYPRTPTFTPRAPTVGADLSCPNITEYTLRIVYAQSMFIPRTRNIYPRTPTFTPTCIHCRGPIYRARILRNTRCGLFTYTNVYPRAPTVGSRFIVPAYYGIHGVDILCFINFVFHLCHSICALMISYFRSVAPTHVATTLN